MSSVNIILSKFNAGFKNFFPLIQMVCENLKQKSSIKSIKIDIFYA
jgi:hypothetical protein